MTEKRAVELTNEQIDFIGTSLKYSARAIRDHDYGPTADPAWVTEHRRESDQMVASIREALAGAQGQLEPRPRAHSTRSASPPSR